MRAELENKLMTDYPFYTGYFGKGLVFECQDGWYDLLVELSDKIKAILDITKDHLSVVQVKEKFGGLRYYVNGATEAIYDLISEYEHKSELICEACGKAGGPVYKGHWIYTRCPECAEKLLPGYSVVQL